MIFGWLFGRGKADIPDDQRVEWEPAGNGIAKNILEDYPDGYVIYVHFNVSGITFRFVDAATFANSQRLSVELERETTNKHDKNAIKVIGVCRRGRYFVGYVPKDVSAHIARSGMYDVLRARLVRIYSIPQDPESNFDHPYVEIQMELVGPKERKLQFEQAAKVSRKRKLAS